MLPVECIVRGYLAGTAWQEYREAEHGLRHAPAGRPAGGRPAAGQPVFTPSTKAASAIHDENIPFDA